MWRHVVWYNVPKEPAVSTLQSLGICCLHLSGTKLQSTYPRRSLAHDKSFLPVILNGNRSDVGSLVPILLIHRLDTFCMHHSVRLARCKITKCRYGFQRIFNYLLRHSPLGWLRILLDSKSRFPRAIIAFITEDLKVTLNSSICIPMGGDWMSI